MPATIHTLFPSAGPAQPPHALVVELRSRALDLLGERVRLMFDSADDLLFEYSERAVNDVERRRYFDTMRVVRLDRARIAEVFAAQIGDGFLPAAPTRNHVDDFDLERLSIQSTEALEEKIALGNMAARAEGSFRSALWQLDRCLDQARASGIEILSDCLNPAKLSAAFGSAIAVLDADFKIKLILFKLFDRALMQALGPLYEMASQVMAQHGFHGGGVQARPYQPAPQPPVGPIAPTAYGTPTAMAEALGPALETLRHHGLDPQRLATSPEPHVAGLGAALQALLGQPSLQAVQASTQRLAMASRMFDELMAEPLLPASLRPALESLRYPAYHAALTEAGFFDDSQHPLRAALDGLVDRILAAQTGDAAATDFQSSIEGLGAQLAPGRSVGYTTLAGAAQLPMVKVERFAEQLRTQARNRRDALLMRVRKQVARDLDAHLVGRPDLPAPTQTLLRSGIAPLFGVRMLRHGRSSDSYRAAEALLDRLLESLDLPVETPVAERLAERGALVDELDQAFADIGMKPDRARTLLDGLKTAYAEFDALREAPSAEVFADTRSSPAPVAAPSGDGADALLIAPFDLGSLSEPAKPRPAPPAVVPAAAADADLPSVTPMELLSRVLTPESWFRVYDAAHEQTRWLKLSSFYAQQDSITFTGFDESNRLVLHASRFAEDLALGHSEPVNPSSEARIALEQLRRAKARGRF